MREIEREREGVGVGLTEPPSRIHHPLKTCHVPFSPKDLKLPPNI